MGMLNKGPIDNTHMHFKTTNVIYGSLIYGSSTILAKHAFNLYSGSKRSYTLLLRLTTLTSLITTITTTVHHLQQNKLILCIFYNLQFGITRIQWIQWLKMDQLTGIFEFTVITQELGFQGEICQGNSPSVIRSELRINSSDTMRPPDTNSSLYVRFFTSSRLSTPAKLTDGNFFKDTSAGIYTDGSEV